MKEIEFAKRFDLSPSPYGEIYAMIGELNAKGIPIINMAPGNPTYPLLPEVSEAMIRTIRKGETRYIPSGTGTQNHKKGAADLANYVCARNGSGFSQENVVVTNGCAHGYWAVTGSVIEPGKSAGILSPYYGYYGAPIKSHGGEVRIIEARRENGYVPTYEDLREAIIKHPEIVALVFNFPHNPTGAMLNEEKAKSFADAINKINKEFPHILFIDDLAYINLVRPRDIRTTYPHLTPEARQNTVLLISGSKSVSLANSRVGAVVSENRELLRRVGNAVIASVMSVPYFANEGFAAGSEVLTTGWKVSDEIVDHYQLRMGIIGKALDDIGRKCSDKIASGDAPPIIDGVPAGGMFLWADMSKVFKGKEIPLPNGEPSGKFIASGADINNFLVGLHEFGYVPVITVPGELFGTKPGDCFLRFACVESEEDMKIAAESLKGAAQLLTGVNLGVRPNLPKQNASRYRHGMPRDAIELRRGADERGI